MNPKDAGFFLKNIEKLVLAASVLILLVVAWWFLMGNPFAIEVSGRDVGPGDIHNTIATKADRLERTLKDETSALPDRPIPEYSKAILEQMADKPTSIKTLVPLAQAGLTAEWGPVGTGTERPTYNLPRPPIAEGLMTRKGHAVLSDNIPTREMEGFIKLVGNHEPRDFQYVSIAATFDMDEWVERLQSGDKESRVPPRWWNSMLGISGVMLQRQELDEATGEWVNEVFVDPIPGQLAFKPTTTFKATNLQAKEAIVAVRASQERIARPEFPQIKGNILWSPPNEDAKELDAEGQRKLARLNTRIASTKEQIARLQEQLLKASQQPGAQDNQGQDRSRRQQTPRASRGGDQGGYGGTTGGSRATRTPRGGARGNQRGADAPATPEERINQLQQQLIETKIDRDELLGIESDVLSRQGYSGDVGGGYGQGDYGGQGGYSGGYGSKTSPHAAPGGYGGQGGYGAPGGYGQQGGYGGYGAPGGLGGPGAYGQDPQAEPESRKLQVWAHDLSIEAGKVYRYRLVVSVLNPLYRQKRVEENQREENYDKIALGPDMQELNASPWSDPVRVDSKHYFFMVKGSAQSQTARAEVWRVYNGRWLNEEFEVRPGDPIGKVVDKELPTGGRKKLDMYVGRVVVDLLQATASSGFGGGGVRMLYLDPENNHINARSDEEDRNNPDRIRLQNELALESELALGSPTDTGQPLTY